jgi:hypothetical protein
MNRFKGSVRSATAAVSSSSSAPGRWTLTEAMQARQNAAWPVAGVGGSIAFASASSQYLTATAAQSPATLGNNLFTIEAFVRFTTLPANGSFASICNQQGDFRFFLNGTPTAGQNQLSVWQSSSPKWISTGTGIVINTWYHICFMRSNNGAATTVCDFYLNGTKLAKSSDTTTSVTYSTTGMLIGGESGGYRIDGYITNYRYVNGTAVYTVSGFTAPTAPLSNITNTQLLLLAATSGTFITDSSTANAGGPYILTNVGGATYNALTPF